MANNIEQSLYCLFLFRNRANRIHPKSSVFLVWIRNRVRVTVGIAVFP